jgi:serine/threonine protein phosphatase PrpC
MGWFLGYAKAVGRSHAASDLPCQDSVTGKVSDDGKRFVIALSDGAGSAEMSDVGSRTLVNFACEKIGGYLNKTADLSAEVLNKLVKEVIISSRASLESLGDLSQFHATVVIAVGSADLIRIYHIGDGAALVAEKVAKNKFVLHRSKPENGEFSNETFFYTQDHWESHLRVMEIKNPAFCIVCSDGIDPFIWDNLRGSRLGFVIPILSKLNLLRDFSSINNTLEEIILDPRTDEVTSDDKSIAVAFYPATLGGKLDKINCEDRELPVFKDPKTLSQELAESLTKNIIINNHGNQISKQQEPLNHLQTPIKNFNKTLIFSLLALLTFCILAGGILMGTSTSLRSEYGGNLYKLFNMESYDQDKKNTTLEPNSGDKTPTLDGLATPAMESKELPAVDNVPQQVRPQKFQLNDSR